MRPTKNSSIVKWSRKDGPPSEIWRRCSPLFKQKEATPFCSAVQALHECVYPGGQAKVGRIMWQLLRLQEGDLVVGIEGTAVKGICQLEHNGWDSYRYDGPDAYNYAHTVGFPVRWRDWDADGFGFTPSTTPL